MTWCTSQVNFSAYGRQLGCGPLGHVTAGREQLYLVPDGCIVLSAHVPALGEFSALHLRHDHPGGSPAWTLPGCEVVQVDAGLATVHACNLQSLRAVAPRADFDELTLTLSPYVRHALSKAALQRDDADCILAGLQLRGSRGAGEPCWTLRPKR